MLRVSRVIAVAAIVAGLPMLAQAAEPATLTLTCKGTATIRADSPKPYPLSMDLIVNFTTRTVDGTGRQRPYVFDDQLQITEWNEVTVIFAACDAKTNTALARPLSMIQIGRGHHLRPAPILLRFVEHLKLPLDGKL